MTNLDAALTVVAFVLSVTVTCSAALLLDPRTALRAWSERRWQEPRPIKVFARADRPSTGRHRSGRVLWGPWAKPAVPA